MIRLVLGRLVAGLVLIVVLTLATYVVFFRVPVDPAQYIAPDATGEQRAEIREQLGIEDPLLQQWGRFAWRLATEADLGMTLVPQPPQTTVEPVNDVLQRSLRPTLSLVLGGLVLMLVLAIPLGILSAIRAGSLLDRAIFGFTVLGVVLHPFVVGLILRDVFTDRWNVAPPGGYCPLRGEALIVPEEYRVEVCGGLADWASHMWVPWLTFAFFFLPLYTRMIRARVLDNLRQQYVLTARAKGASERRIVTRHVARNASGPIVAMLAVDVAVIVTAAIYVETVFGLPGIGGLVVRNLAGEAGYDLHVLVGVVVLVAVGITTLSLLSDVTVRALDPRVRLDGSRGR